MEDRGKFMTDSLSIYEKIYDYIDNEMQEKNIIGDIPKFEFVYRAEKMPDVINLKRLYSQNVSEEDFIKLAYIEILGRNVDESGYNSWKNNIKKIKPELFREELVIALIKCDEGRKRGFNNRIVTGEDTLFKDYILQYMWNQKDWDIVDVDRLLNYDIHGMEYINLLFFNALDRSVDEKALKHWEEIYSKTPEEEFKILGIKEIVFSKEAKIKRKKIINNTSNIKNNIIADYANYIISRILNIAYYKGYKSLPQGMQDFIKDKFSGKGR